MIRSGYRFLRQSKNTRLLHTVPKYTVLYSGMSLNLNLNTTTTTTTTIPRHVVLFTRLNVLECLMQDDEGV
jgi:hypothetical protein